MQFLINIDVDNLDHATDFYSRAFQLQVGRRLGADCVELVGGSTPIYLLVKAAGTQSSTTSEQVRDYRRHWTPVHLDIVVDDIQTAIECALAAGGKLEQAIGTASWGKLALMADPFGNGFCIVQFLGRGYDEIASSYKEAKPIGAA